MALFYLPNRIYVFNKHGELARHSAPDKIPKPNPVQRQKTSPYAALIAEATGAPESKLALLEDLMRTEIFHSTLDWQSAAELADGARQAYDLYRSAPLFFDAIRIHRQTLFRVTSLEVRLEKSRKSAPLEKLRDLELRIEMARNIERAAHATAQRLADFHAN